MSDKYKSSREISKEINIRPDSRDIFGHKQVNLLFMLYLTEQNKNIYDDIIVMKKIKIISLLIIGVFEPCLQRSSTEI